MSDDTSTDQIGRCGPDTIDAGDKIQFEYGSRPYTSTKKVTEVQQNKVRVEGGGRVYYRDIKQIIRPGDENYESGWK